ncbi:MAG: F0F1 ATP synthase subunit B [Pseudomonadota bacterium]
MATTEDAAHGAEAASSGLFPPFDTSTYASQLFWLVIAFGLTYYVISKIAGPRISGILEDRHDRIASDLAEAERLKSETQSAMESYESALSDARSKAQAVASETRDKLTAETTAKREASEKALSEKLSEAETRIASIKSEALTQVDTIAADAAGAILEKLAPKVPDAGAISQAIGDVAKG